MSETILKKFGRYILLDRLAQGGMAEIFRARASAPDGGARILVIKRIQANYRSNKEFLEMFKAEIKLTMGFNHPNIVQLYDYGDSHGTPYIAMEYVDGKTVRQFAGRFFKKKELLPVDLVLGIVEQAARGLAYAHGFRDKMSGDELHIVHRDISPQNIIISYDGVVKLIDFGIAKARTSASLTRTGIIKGKPSYMAPEQVHGEDLDGRSDIFSLGIVLWELLTGKKLFSTTGKSEYTVLKMIESCDKIVKPPSALNPSIKPELDEIVLRALAKDRNERYESATELQRALQKHLVINYPDHNISEIPYWMDRLFSEDKAEDQKRIRDLNHQAEEIIEEAPELTEDEVNSEVLDIRESDIPREKVGKKPDTLGGVLMKDLRGGAAASIDATGNKADTASGARAAAHARQEFVLEAFGATPAASSIAVSERTIASQNRVQRGGTAMFQSKRIRNTGKRTAAIVGAVALLGLILFPEVLTKIPFVADVAIGAKQVLIELQSQKRYIPVVSEIVRVLSRKKPERVPAGTSPTSAPAPTAPPAPISNSTFLNLRVSPAGLGTKITINGKVMWAPVPLVELPLGTAIDILVERPGFKPLKKQVTMAANLLNATREYPLEVSLEPQTFGFLSARGNLSSEIYVREVDPVTKIPPQDSSTWYFKARFEQQKFPPGTYLVQLTNRALEMEAVETVRVEKDLISKVSAELVTTLASNLSDSPDKSLGLVGWFRASSITGFREHEVVDAWNDASKNLNQFVQKDPVKRPALLPSGLNGHAILSFNGKTSGLDSESLASRLRGGKTVTVIYVVRMKPTGHPQTVIGCYGRNGGRTIFEVAFDAQSKILVREGDSSYSSTNRAIASEASSGKTNGFGIYSAVLTADKVIVHENGAKKVAVDGNGSDFANTVVCSIGRGWTFNQPRDFLDGDLAEVLVYDHALSVREQDGIERYLGQVYKIPLTK